MDRNRYILGLSGGIDSCWALHEAHKMNYNIVAVTFMNGWDTEIATQNTKAACDYFNVKHEIKRCDQQEFYDIQRAFLYASTPDAEAPTDLAIKKSLLIAMDEFKADKIITGANIQTEGVMPEEWSMIDGLYLKDVCKKHGVKLKSFFNMSLMDIYRYKKHTYNILESRLSKYDPEKSKLLLHDLFGWEDYGAKHCESVYTRFIRGLRYYKFGIDVRVIEFHAKVKAGLMTYKEMVTEMQTPIVSYKQFMADWNAVEHRLDVKRDEIMALPRRSFRNYRTYRYHPLVRLAKKLR